MCRNWHSTELVFMYRQEEAEQGEDQGAGEDRCHQSAYNRRLRATQSPNDTLSFFVPE